MTDNPDINPYAPPSATVVDATADGYRDFPRIATWWVFLLLVITLGLYGPYWLYTRIKILNGRLSSDQIPIDLPIAVLVLSLVDLAAGVAVGFYPDGGWVQLLSTGVRWPAIGVNLVCVFSFRKRLNQHADASSEGPYWVGGVATFFLQVLYLNYKLNQRIDAERITDSSGTGTAHLAHGRAY
jgi:hypothetical protein